MNPDKIQARIKVAVTRANNLESYLETFMSDMEHNSESTTTLPECFDDVLEAHEKVAAALYTLQSRLEGK